jgi:hypothetical protein
MMPRVLITARVQDGAQWERAFRTHADLLRSMTQSFTHYAVTDDNEIALYAEPEDLDTFMEVYHSEATADAMGLDGVDRESVKLYVLDKTFEY